MDPTTFKFLSKQSEETEKENEAKSNEIKKEEDGNATEESSAREVKSEKPETVEESGELANTKIKSDSVDMTTEGTVKKEEKSEAEKPDLDSSDNKNESMIKDVNKVKNEVKTSDKHGGATVNGKRKIKEESVEDMKDVKEGL